MLRAMSRPPMTCAVALGLALAIAGAGAGVVPARAQAPDYDAAKQHYQAAEAAMNKGEFATAAREYGIAYDITRDAVLFFKIGSAFKRAGDCKSAVVYFKRYLAEASPDPAFRAKATDEIAGCGDDPAATTPPTVEPATPPAQEPVDASGDPAVAPATSLTGAPLGMTPPSYYEQRSSWQRTAAWTSVGLSLAFVTAGGVLGLSATSRQEDVENLTEFRDPQGDPARFQGTTRERYEDLVEEGEDLEKLSIIAFSAAGATAALAIVFFIVDATSDGRADEVTVTPTAGPEGLGLAAGWRF